MSYVNFEGSRIYFNVKGEGKPILFGHSYLWDSEMWTELVGQLSNTFCCVCVDLPGHGRSDCIEDLSLKKLSDMHKAVMKSLGYFSFNLVGLSIGAMWGTLLANDPDVKVEKFVIMNSSLSPERQDKITQYMGMLKTIEELGFIPVQIIDAIAPGFFSERGRGLFLGEYKKYLQNISSSQIPSIAEIGRAFVNRGNLLSDFKKFKGDLMVLAGAEDHYRSVEEANHISEAFDIKSSIIQAGHISVLEQNTVIANLLRDFLK